MNRSAAALLLMLMTASGWAQPRPTFTHSGNMVTAELPLAILADSKVKQQLSSGLTTTFLLVARRRAPSSLDGARLEIRYDLWDEVWHVRRIEHGRPPERLRLPSRQALESWWRAPVRLFAAESTPVNFDLELRVLPFSAAEEQETRDWVSKSGGVGTPARTSGLVDALIGTTIAPKPIIIWRWSAIVALQ